MIIRDIGILGMGAWEGEVVDNDFFGQKYLQNAQVKDPYRGRRADDGSVRISGIDFTPEKYPRALAAIEEAFRDPFRGTRRRRYFPHDLKVSDAESDAARRALADAGVEASAIDAVLVQSFLPDELQPKNAALVAHNLGITKAPAWEIDSICNSAITQLTVASSLILSGLAQRVLCVQSCAYSRVTDRGSSSTVAEADMATSFVVGRVPGTSIAASWRTDGQLHGAIRLEWRAPTGAARRFWEHPREQLLIGFDQGLQERVLNELADYARLVCREALERAEMTMDEVDLFIAHQPMAWNKAFLADVLGLRDGVAYDTFEEYASVNSAGIPVSLMHAIREGRVRRGSKVLLFGPAAGYTYSAAAIRW